MKRRFHPSALAMMTVILLLAFALGAAGLNADIVQGDEIYTLHFIGAFDGARGYSQIDEKLREHVPDHVPLYYFLVAAWGQAAGWSQVSLRLFSLFAGLATLACLYRFAADVFDKRTAALAALLMGTSAFALYYFHELRLYTFLMALAIAHSWAYFRIIYRDDPSRGLWALFLATAVALLHTHNFALILLGGLFAGHVIWVRPSRSWWRVMLGWLVGGLTFLPYAGSLLDRSFTFGASERADSTFDLLLALAKMMGNGSAILCIFLMAVLAYALWPARNRRALHLLTVAGVMLIILLFANWRFDLIPITRVRYFLILWWAAMVLFAYGLVALFRWRMAAGLFAVLWCGAGLQLMGPHAIPEALGAGSLVREYPPLHRYVERLGGAAREEEHVLGFTEENWVNHDRDHYLGKGSVDYYLNLQLGVDGWFIDVNRRPWEIRRDARRIVEAHPRILFVHDPRKHQPAVETVEEALRAMTVPCEVLFEEPDMRVRRYVHPLLKCERGAGAIDYDNGLRLIDRGARYDADEGVARALLWWDAAGDSTLDEYNVSVQIIASEWENVQQGDRPLRDMRPWSVIELRTEGLPAGEYRLMLVLYNRETGERVSVGGADMLELTSFSLGAQERAWALGSKD